MLLNLPAGWEAANVTQDVVHAFAVIGKHPLEPT
jgi:hypothetical protein